MSMKNRLLMTGAALAALCVPAAAGIVTYTSYGFNGVNVNIIAPYTISGGAGLITLHPGGQEEWCVDVFTYLANSSPASSPYVEMPLAGGEPGVPAGLTHTQIGVMGALMKHGDAFSLPNEFGAIQLAIWSEEYGTAFVYNGVPPSVTSLAATYLADARTIWTPDFNIIALVDLPALPNQTLANVATIPETSTWLMMLAGFGALGIAGWRRTVRA
jgi:hypothetical protein